MYLFFAFLVSIKFSKCLVLQLPVQYRDTGPFLVNKDAYEVYDPDITENRLLYHATFESAISDYISKVTFQSVELFVDREQHVTRPRRIVHFALFQYNAIITICRFDEGYVYEDGYFITFDTSRIRRMVRYMKGKIVKGTESVFKHGNIKRILLNNHCLENKESSSDSSEDEEPTDYIYMDELEDEINLIVNITGTNYFPSHP